MRPACRRSSRIVHEPSAWASTPYPRRRYRRTAGFSTSTLRTRPRPPLATSNIGESGEKTSATANDPPRFDDSDRRLRGLCIEKPLAGNIIGQVAVPRRTDGDATGLGDEALVAGTGPSDDVSSKVRMGVDSLPGPGMPLGVPVRRYASISSMKSASSTTARLMSMAPTSVADTQVWSWTRAVCTAQDVDPAGSAGRLPQSRRSLAAGASIAGSPFVAARSSRAPSESMMATTPSDLGDEGTDHHLTPCPGNNRVGIGEEDGVEHRPHPVEASRSSWRRRPSSIAR